MTVINPFDFFVEEYASTTPSPIPSDAARRPRALSAARRRGPGPARVRGPLVRAWRPQRGPRRSAKTRGSSTSSSASTKPSSGMSPTRCAWSPASRPPITPERRARVVPRQRLAARLHPAELGLAARFVSGYLVQLVRRPVSGRRPQGPARTSPTCTPGPRSTSPAPAGSGWTRPLACSPAKATSRCPRPRTPPPPRRSPARPSQSRSASPSPTGHPHPRGRPRHPPLLRRASGPPSTRSARSSTTTWRLGRAPDDGRRADLRRHRRHETRSGPPPPTAPRSAAGDRPRHPTPTSVCRGACVHHGQGKWYPGEPLPRWQISTAGVLDGEPLWRDQELLDDPWGQAPATPGRPRPAELSRDLALAIARRNLGVPAHACRGIRGPVCTPRGTTLVARPVRAQPPTSPHDADALASPEPARSGGPDRRGRPDAGARRRVGAAPLRRPEGRGWGTTWRLRRRHLILPGDLARRPAAAAGLTRVGDGPAVHERLPSPSAGLLPPPTRTPPDGGPGAILDIEEAPRTALAIEHRDGHLFVFLPPIAEIELALELVTAIEACRCGVGDSRCAGGYPLPGDPASRPCP
jgi:hypothetical protein